LRHSTLLLTTLLAFAPPLLAESATAIFAGGCFWCMESAYEERTGVKAVVSGFTGGTLKEPTYSGNHNGHFEAVEVTYDPSQVSYQELLDLFWRNIDPFDNQGQFCDKGPSYRSAIFVGSEQEQDLAMKSRTAVAKRFSDHQVVTEILEASDFWPVEEYHQDYYLKNPARYRYYRWRCGRDQRLNELWGEDPGAHIRD
jgi:peptide-methionine (S)-S-oxide reductase